MSKAIVDVVREVMPPHGGRFTSVSGPHHPNAFCDGKRVIVCLDGKQLSDVTLAHESDSMVFVYDINESGEVVVDPRNRQQPKRAELSGKVELFLEGTEAEHDPMEIRKRNTRAAIRIAKERGITE